MGKTPSAASRKDGLAAAYAAEVKRRSLSFGILWLVFKEMLATMTPDEQAGWLSRLHMVDADVSTRHNCHTCFLRPHGPPTHKEPLVEEE